MLHIFVITPPAFLKILTINTPNTPSITFLFRCRLQLLIRLTMCIRYRMSIIPFLSDDITSYSMLVSQYLLMKWNMKMQYDNIINSISCIVPIKYNMQLCADVMILFELQSYTDTLTLLRSGHAMRVYFNGFPSKAIRILHVLITSFCYLSPLFIRRFANPILRVTHDDECNWVTHYKQRLIQKDVWSHNTLDHWSS